MISKRSQSPVGLIVVTFLSLCSMGIILHGLLDRPLEKHHPSQLCGSSVQVIVAIRTAPSHYSTRRAIRKSIGNEATRTALPWRILFYMGSTQDPKSSRVLRKEIKKDDIAVAPIPDSSPNAIRIFLEMAAWLHQHCSAQYVVHINDTTFPDLLGLHMYIANLSEEDNGFHCSVQHSVREQSDPAQKQFFLPHVFPAYCEGDAFVLKTKFLEILVNAAENSPQFPLFGQYVTGQLAKVSNLGHKNIAEAMAGVTDTGKWTERKLFITRMVKVSLWKLYWMKMLVCYQDNENITSELTERIMNKFQIKLLN
ncbi:beta-1,3-galactosyltransferase 9-like [Ixodes scapularis]|uniref:beta-1,3-galactosyltransferase 9-like n=1 Tax=Ixodes scapularis TaxID=6945 RepID=UPI001A9D3B7B|nr:beta-1,3-galactosyltransferase 9-like [Ixodes scapularis]